MDLQRVVNYARLHTRVCETRSMATPSMASLPTRSCGSASLGGVTALGSQVVAPLLDRSEKFASLVSCGGYQLLTTRDVDHNRRCFRMVVRPLWSNATLGTPVHSSCDLADIGHNTALLCPSTVSYSSSSIPVTIYGGQHAPIHIGTRINHVGIRRVESASYVRDGSFFWESSFATSLVDAAARGLGTVVFKGEPGTCLEERAVGPGKMPCEFDGKLSVVRWRGRLLMYARANMMKTGGGDRHVQVARSIDDGLTWSSFKLIEFGGGAAPVKAENNIYFINVQPGGAGKLLATFPAVLDGEAGVWLSTSADGWLWSRPSRLLASNVYTSWRTDDHPAGIVLAASTPRSPTPSGRRRGAASEAKRQQRAPRGRQASLYVLRGAYVDDGSAKMRGRTAASAPPMLCRYDFDCASDAARHLCSSEMPRSTSVVRRSIGRAPAGAHGHTAPRPPIRRLIPRNRTRTTTTALRWSASGGGGHRWLG